MFRKPILSTGIFFLGLLLFFLSSSLAQVPHSVLGMVRNDNDNVPPANDVTFVAFLIDVSDGGVQSETRSNYDTGNAYGNGVMGEGWFELECANYTQFEWANGDSLRLAIANATNDQLLILSIPLDAAVEPQLVQTAHLQPFLQNLNATGSDDQVRVAWTLHQTAPDLTFHIFRSTAEEGFYQKLNAEPIVPDQPKQYVYTDYQVSNGITYWYKLGLAEFSDSLSLFGPVSATARTDVAQENDFSGPTSYQLFQNYPNPFNPRTTIKYQVPQTSRVSLVIYNLLGQRVRTLVKATQQSGTYQVDWDGRDEWGNSVASGIYFFRLAAGPYARIRKMTLLK